VKADPLQTLFPSLPLLSVTFLSLMMAACGQAISFPTKFQLSVSKEASTYFLLHSIALTSGTAPNFFFWSTKD